MDTETEGQSVKETNRRTDRQGRETYRQTRRQSDGQTDSKLTKATYGHRFICVCICICVCLVAFLAHYQRPVKNFYLAPECDYTAQHDGVARLPVAAVTLVARLRKRVGERKSRREKESNRAAWQANAGISK